MTVSRGATSVSEPLRTGEGADVPARLAAYYARYYRDTLGIPGWRDHVAFRVTLMK